MARERTGALRAALARSEESETRMRAVVDNALDAIITIDERGTVLSFNPAAESVFGYRVAEALGHNVNMLMPLRYSAEHDGYIANHLGTGEAKIIGIGREVQGRRKDGSVFPIELGIDHQAHAGAVCTAAGDQRAAACRARAAARPVTRVLAACVCLGAAARRCRGRTPFAKAVGPAHHRLALRPDSRSSTMRARLLCGLLVALVIGGCVPIGIQGASRLAVRVAAGSVG